MARQNGGTAWYMRCATYSQRHHYPGRPDCHSNYIREDEAMRLLADYIRALGTDDTLDRVFHRLQEQQRADESQGELSRLRHRLSELDSQRERLALAYAAGDMPLAYYRRADESLAAQQDTARLRASELERYLNSLPDMEAKRRQLRWLFDNFDVLLERAEPAEMSKALQEAGFKVLVEEGKGRVEWE